MGSPNINMVSAEVDGTSVSFTGSGAANANDWTLDDDVRVFDFDGAFTIEMDFDEAHIGGGGTSDPYVINSEGNLSSLFSAYTLSMDPVSGVLSLTVNKTDFLGTGTAQFQVGGHGDVSDNVFISFVCFADGTQIKTVDGPRKVERLRVGDLIPTKSGTVQPIRWIGSRKLDSIDLATHPHLRPIEIDAGALGNGKPRKPLTLSPQHRVFVSSPEVQLLFGMDEALVPAKGLVNGTTIRVSRQDTVTYYHILFDRHELIKSHGTWTESFYPGEEALVSLDQGSCDEVLELFPELRRDDHGFVTAAPTLTKRETKLIATPVK